jgi:hypothetical protein
MLLIVNRVHHLSPEIPCTPIASVDALVKPSQRYQDSAISMSGNQRAC